ncbi:hypothetical protein NE237_003236 [Protea cynaroides]|uniref:Uncharacterized protein n=1 Tax=Protea cynaroides TaxID=273540 RepID=A0A9Q0QSE8_9MAGN|nr:hypothetical protein NE237_003236 [Protea cynaroides]
MGHQAPSQFTASVTEDPSTVVAVLLSQVGVLRQLPPAEVPERGCLIHQGCSLAYGEHFHCHHKVPLAVYAFTLPLPYIGIASSLPTGFVTGVVVLISGLLLYCWSPSSNSSTTTL